MKDILTMDQYGRLVLPGHIRKALQISASAAFRAEVVGNKVELTLMPASNGVVLKRRRGLLVISTGGHKFNATDAIKVIREERV